MTEGRGTGIPKVLKAVQANESPAPVFHTDPDRTFFLAEFPLHPAFAGDLPSEATPQIAGTVEAQEAQVGLAKWQLDLLVACSSGEKTGQELMRVAGYKSRTGNFKKGLQHLLEEKLLELTLQDKPNSSLQKYRLTTKGRGLLEKLVTAGRIKKSG